MFFKRSAAINFLSDEEKKEIVLAIQKAEKKTSGEIRVFIEKKCRYVDPLDRAVEIFYQLKMSETIHHNSVLIYVAYKDRQMAVYGDKGIHEKVGNEYWTKTVKEILGCFKEGNIFRGLETGIAYLGGALVEHFPYHNEDKNELTDDIVFGD
ncbi:MAG: TPM domain-containing protein [Bacteroidota bacterium]